MRWSKLFIPTLREDPGEAESVSHRLLLRAGYLRPLPRGIYSHLFLSQRSLRKITVIVRQEMERIGAQEVWLPAIHPGMTQEEVVTTIARGPLRSYKQLPQIWYQIQTKVREEPQPKSASPRVSQFLTKDSFSFDFTREGLDAACAKHQEAYGRIFRRCGLAVLPLDSHFMVASDTGEDLLVACPKCGYAATLAKAAAHSLPPVQPDPEGNLKCEEFHTPGRKTIAEIAEFTGLPETSQIKSLVMLADGRPILALVRGDHQLSETRLAKAVEATEIRAAYPAEIEDWFGASAGSLGPVGVKNLRVLADSALKGRRNMIAGANKDDYHLRNVTPEKDFDAEFHDLRQVAAGDACSHCGAALEIRKGIEVAHISKVADTGLRVTDPDGKEVAPAMGSHGIQIERILHCVVEQNHDKDGMILPAAIAPFDVVITPVYFADPQQKDIAESIYQSCLASGIDALLDDRDERPGVKFKDADLIGVPCRIVVGKKITQGLVELVDRRTRNSTEARIEEVVGQAIAFCGLSHAQR